MIFNMALNQSHIPTSAALIQVNTVLILQTIAHYKRRTNELLNLLASVSLKSSQKGAKKMRKKCKPKRFWTRPGRTGIWWQNFLDIVVILEEWITHFRLSKDTFIDLCDELRICFLCFPCVLMPFSWPMHKRKIQLLCDVTTIVFHKRTDIAPASCKQDATHHTPACFTPVSYRTGVVPASCKQGLKIHRL